MISKNKRGVGQSSYPQGVPEMYSLWQDFPWLKDQMDHTRRWVQARNQALHCCQSLQHRLLVKQVLNSGIQGGNNT